MFAIHLMPRWVPLTAETTKAAVSTTIAMIATVLLLGASKTLVSPLLIWIAPSPREVAAPNVVMNSPNTSTARRAGWEVSFPGNTMELRRLG
jgi:hypothetical protein